MVRRRRSPVAGVPARAVQVAEQIRQALGLMLGDGSIKDPRLGAALVTVTDVEMTPDLREACVFVSVFPEDAPVLTEVFAGLKSASGEIRRQLGGRLRMRFTPSLEFRFDGSILEGHKIESLLREIHDRENVAS